MRSRKKRNDNQVEAQDFPRVPKDDLDGKETSSPYANGQVSEPLSQLARLQELHRQLIQKRMDCLHEAVHGTTNPDKKLQLTAEVRKLNGKINRVEYLMAKIQDRLALPEPNKKDKQTQHRNQLLRKLADPFSTKLNSDLAQYSPDPQQQLDALKLADKAARRMSSLTAEDRQRIQAMKPQQKNAFKSMVGHISTNATMGEYSAQNAARAKIDNIKGRLEGQIEANQVIADVRRSKGASL